MLYAHHTLHRTMHRRMYRCLHGSTYAPNRYWRPCYPTIHVQTHASAASRNPPHPSAHIYNGSHRHSSSGVPCRGEAFRQYRSSLSPMDTRRNTFPSAARNVPVIQDAYPPYPDCNPVHRTPSALYSLPQWCRSSLPPHNVPH